VTQAWWKRGVPALWPRSMCLLAAPHQPWPGGPGVRARAGAEGGAQRWSFRNLDAPAGSGACVSSSRAATASGPIPATASRGEPIDPPAAVIPRVHSHAAGQHPRRSPPSATRSATSHRPPLHRLTSARSRRSFGSRWKVVGAGAGPRHVEESFVPGLKPGNVHLFSSPAASWSSCACVRMTRALVKGQQAKKARRCRPGQAGSLAPLRICSTATCRSEGCTVAPRPMEQGRIRQLRPRQRAGSYGPSNRCCAPGPTSPAFPARISSWSKPAAAANGSQPVSPFLPKGASCNEGLGFSLGWPL